MSVLLGFLLNRFSAPSLSSLSRSSIAGKTVLITGASRGLGLEAARHYVRLGTSRVILGVRSQSKGEAAKEDILASAPTGGPNAVIDVWLLDLASFSSVKAFADRVTQELDCLDIVILNAAVSKRSFQLTLDGWEETLQVNVLSTALLALLLLPKLRESKSSPDWTARLSIVASRAHQSVKSGLQDQLGPSVLEGLNKSESFGLGGLGARYSVSKLLTIYVVNEIVKLATMPDGKPAVVVNYSCPGACVSHLPREHRSAFLPRVALFLVNVLIAKTAEEGSRTIVKASCSAEESHGKWFHNDKFEE